MEAIEELLKKAAKEAGNTERNEWPMHNQQCQQLINQALAELKKPVRSKSNERR